MELSVLQENFTKALNNASPNSYESELNCLYLNKYTP